MTTLNTSARVLLAGTALGLLCACAPGPSQPANPEATPAATATSPAPAATESRQLAVGQNLDIALEVTAGTGYTWEVKQNGAPVLRLEPTGPAEPTTHDGRVGGPEIQRWRFVAVQPGQATVQLVYRRPWEKDVAPEREARYEVHVR